MKIRCSSDAKLIEQICTLPDVVLCTISSYIEYEADRIDGYELGEEHFNVLYFRHNVHHYLENNNEAKRLHDLCLIYYHKLCDELAIFSRYRCYRTSDDVMKAYDKYIRCLSEYEVVMINLGSFERDW